MNARPLRLKTSILALRAITLTSLLMVPFSPLKAAASDDLGLSEYHTFLVYPHIEKAMQAMKTENRAVALSEFLRAHQLVPDNPQISLYLSEAYRHFGDNDNARQVLETQSKLTPDNARVRDALNAIPIRVDNLSALHQLDATCQAHPSDICLSNVGDHALLFDQFNLAISQLDNDSFASSQSGMNLRRSIIQRAIGSQHWRIADQQFALLSKQTRLKERENDQWFGLLIAQHEDQRLIELQNQGRLNKPVYQLILAQSLASRAEEQRLAEYLAARENNNQPQFSSPEQERDWLYLLATGAKTPPAALIAYPLQFAENRGYVAENQLPALLARHDDAGVARLLAQLPADEKLPLRMALSVRQEDSKQAIAIANRLMAAQPHDWSLLDSLSYQLLALQQPEAAAQLLIDGWSYAGASGPLRLRLIDRLGTILHDHPALLTATRTARLRQPLPTAALRVAQANLLSQSGTDCQQTLSLLSDFSPSYDATSWARIARCYQTSSPGMALYAWRQAVARDNSDMMLRGLAYQTYAVEDYAAAVAAWQRLPAERLTAEDALAAANSALAAQNWPQLDAWLGDLRRLHAAHGENYFWLEARLQNHQGNNGAALRALDQAIATQPSSRAWALKGQLLLAQCQQTAGIAALRQATTLAPQDTSAHSALGFALFNAGQFAPARQELTLAHQATPDDENLVRQLVYVNQRLSDAEQTRRYSRQAIDMIDNAAGTQPLSSTAADTRFSLRRIHEDSARRWTFTFDGWTGTDPGSALRSTTSSASSNAQQNSRSYGQFEGQYKIGDNQLREGDTLAAYGRLFAGGSHNGENNSDSGNWPIYTPMAGAGLRWKPLHDQVFYLAAEEQVPLDHHRGRVDTLLRASASFFNSGRYSDEWHPNGSGWIAQNLYLDAGHYLKNNQENYTADYRLSWHQKVHQGQTLEPYGHIQGNAELVSDSLSDRTQWDQYSSDLLGGVGMRYNLWLGQTRYDAWPHKISIGLEYQYVFTQRQSQTNGLDYRDSVIFTLGGRW